MPQPKYCTETGRPLKPAAKVPQQFRKRIEIEARNKAAKERPPRPRVKPLVTAIQYAIRFQM